VRLAKQKKEEEERIRAEETEKKGREAEEKRKRLEEAEKKRQAMVSAQREKQEGRGLVVEQKVRSGCVWPQTHFVLSDSHGEHWRRWQGCHQDKGPVGGREESLPQFED
jgi:hypothetical protein